MVLNINAATTGFVNLYRRTDGTLYLSAIVNPQPAHPTRNPTRNGNVFIRAVKVEALITLAKASICAALQCEQDLNAPIAAPDAEDAEDAEDADEADDSRNG